MAWFEHEASRIYYEEEGNGDAVMLIPGITLGIDDLQLLRQALVPRYRVIAADAPGSGRSGPQPREYAASYYQDDALAFLTLLDRIGATPAHVVGCSDGGEYALIMAELKPAAVRSIVTWGAAGRLAMPPEFVEAFGRVIDDPIPPLLDFSHYLKTTYGEENARITTRSVANAWQAIIDAGGDVSRKRAHEIACPALLITGEQDSMFARPEVVSDMAGAMRKAEFIEVEGAGHLVHHDSPDWLLETIVGWLARH
jgi:valacyclovir hydrolase